MENRFILRLMLGWLLVMACALKGQLSGTLTVPGTYASLSAAIADINAQGVNGPLTIAVQAGYSETVTAGGFSLTATGTATNPILFTKYGTGSNPLLVSYTGGSGTAASAVQDGVWRLIGCDYVTIDGIDIFDQNTTNPATMEYGIGLFKSNPGNGCQYNEIRNCTITLKVINNATGAASASDGSRGINVVNATATGQNSNITPFAPAGSNSYNRFYNNTISDCNIGIALIGYAAPSPYTFADSGNEIGGTAPGMGNYILNFGGGSGAVNPSAGIRTSAQYNFTVAGNVINNNTGTGTNHPAALRGILLLPAVSASVSVLNNSISLSGGNGTQSLTAIENQSAGGGVFIAQSNTISAMNFTIGSTGSVYGIYNNQAAVTSLLISDNLFSNISAMTSSGNVFLIYNNAVISSAGTFTNNIFTQVTHSATSTGSFYGIFNGAASVGNLMLSSNSFSSCSVNHTSGSVNLILNTSLSSGLIEMNFNTIRSFSATASNNGTLGLVYNNGASAATLSINSNTIQNSFLNNNSGAYHLLYNRGVLTNTSASIFMENNFFSQVTYSSSSNGAMYSIWNNGMTSTLSSVSNNTIQNCEWRTTSSLRYLISHWGPAENIQMNNNIITACTGTTGTSGAINFIFANNPSSISSSTLSINSNTLSNLVFSTTSADQIFIQSTGVTTNTYAAIQLRQNLISNISSTASTGGGNYAIYNNAASAQDLSIQSNTISNSIFSQGTGVLYQIQNRGISGSFFGTVNMNQNSVQTNTYLATGTSNMQLLSNIGVASTSCTLLRLTANHLNGLLFNTTSSPFTGILNSSPVSGTVAIVSNTLSNVLHPQNQTGLLIDLHNSGGVGAELSMSGNSVTGRISTASTGARYIFYNTGAVTGSGNISDNLLTALQHTVSSSAILVYVFNSSPSSGSIRINTNTITVCSSSLQSGATYLLYNSSALTNTISELRMEFNAITSNTIAATTGGIYGVFNNLATSTLVSISSNTLSNLLVYGLSNSKFLITNSGVTTNSLALNLNQISTCYWPQNTSGSVYGIYNTGNSVAASVASNTIFNLPSSASTGSVFLLFNTATVSSSLNIIGNTIRQFTNTATGSGYFGGVQNSGIVSGTMNLSGNRLEDLSLQTTSGSTHLLCNRGAATATINLGLIASNVFSNVIHSSTTGSFATIFNNNFTSTNFSISGNTLSAIALSGTSAARAFINNSGNVSGILTINSNLLSQISYSVFPSALNTLLLNTGNASGTISINSNRVLNNVITNSLATLSLLHNSGSAGQSLQISTNALLQNTVNITGDGSFNGILNTSPSGNTIVLSSNTLAANSISASAVIQLLSSTRASSLVSASVEINSNSITSNTLQALGGNILICGSSSLTTQRLEQNDNRFINNSLMFGNGSVSGAYCLAGNNQTLTINGNQFLGNSFLGSGLLNVVLSAGTHTFLAVNTNTISTSLLGGLSGRFIHNAAVIPGSAQISQNVLSGNSQTASVSGPFCAILNSGIISGNCDIVGNYFSSNSTAAFSSSIGLIYNSGPVAGLLQISTNSLSQTFSANGLGFASNLMVITNQSGASSGSLAITQNTFSNFIFNSGATGDINYISNYDNPSVTTINSNNWSNLILNHSGQHQFIYNDAVQGITSVNSNSILGGYQISGSPGSIRLYSDAGNLIGNGSQLISNNQFNSISGNNPGSASFFGIYSQNAVGSKSITANQITNINFNANGFMYLIGSDYLNDNSGNSASAITSNTLGAINWQGPFYGVQAGPNMGGLLPVMIADNSVVSVTTAAGFSGSYGISVLSTGAGAHVYRNKVGDILETSNIGALHGLHISANAYARAANNVIGNLRTPGSNLIESENGILVEGSALCDVFYNTVYLNGAATGNNSGANCLSRTGLGSVNLRNNILVNLRQSAGLGKSIIFKNNLSGASGYSVSSNNNLFYAGIPSPSRLIYSSPTTDFSLFPIFQSLVSPADLNSVSELPAFQSTLATSPLFLHLNPSVNNLSESAAQMITAVIDDFDSNPRQGSANYVGSGTNPDIGADEFETSLQPCSSANAGTISAASGSVMCAGQAAYLFSSGFSTDGGITYQWKASPSAAGPFSIVPSAVRPVLITPTLSSGIYYFILETTCQNGPLTTTSNVFILQVNALPGAVAIASPSNVCAGNTVSLSAQSAAGSSFYWTGPSGFTSAVNSPVLSNVNTIAGGTYTVVAQLGGCISSALVSFSVDVAPPPFQLSPSSSSICTGYSVQIRSTIPITSPTLTAGNQVLQNSAAGYPAPYSVYYGGQKMQFLIRASELSAAGFTTGTPLTDIRFPVVALGSGWGSQIQSCQNFQVAIKSTSLNSLSQFENNLTIVSPANNFTPTIGYSNSHVFATPFVWDGQSNLVLETVFSNNIIGSGALSVIQNIHNCGFQSTQLYRADNQPFAAVASASVSNISLNFIRPDFQLNGQSVGNYSWTPSTFLNSTNNSSAVVAPTASQLYTVTLTKGNCSTVNTFSVTTYTVPQITIAASSNSICAGNLATLTASGAPFLQWSNGSSAASIVVNPMTTNVYSVQGTNGFCPPSTASINLGLLPPLTLTISATPSVICQGQVATLSGVGAQTYSWNANANSSTLAVNPSVTTVYTLSGSLGPGCSAIRAFTLQVNPLPMVIASSNGNSVCPGQEIKMNALGANSYTWYPDMVSSPQLTVYPTSSSVYTVIGTDGNKCNNTATIGVEVMDCTSLNAFNSEKALEVFPNPFTDQFEIKFSAKQLRSIRLYGSDGRLILNYTTDENSVLFSAGHLAKGLYLLQVEAAGRFNCFRLTKE